MSCFSTELILKVSHLIYLLAFNDKQLIYALWMMDIKESRGQGNTVHTQHAGQSTSISIMQAVRSWADS